MMITGVRDLSIAVFNLDAAMTEFHRKFGLEPRYIQSEARPPVQVRTALYEVGPAGLALMESSEAGSPIDRFLQRRGEGFFSVSLQVDDVRATVAEMSNRGVQFVLEDPISMKDFKAFDGVYGESLMNFTRPKTTFGVVFELQQLIR